MDQLYEQLLRDMEMAFEQLACKVPLPQKVPFVRDRFVFRYVERTAQQAIIQKLARIVTGLRAAHLLLKNGLVQEQAALERVLDELQQDVLLLTYGIAKNELEERLHKDYLEAFYQEEFDDPASALNSTQKRRMVPRRENTGLHCARW